MSHIFDALQRSESELSGTDSPELVEATELLQRAERREASKWVAALPTKGASTVEGGVHEELSGPHGETGEETSKGSTEEVHSTAAKHDVIFPQFQVLKIALPPHNRLVCCNEEESLAAEAFRLLGVRLQHLRRDRSLKRLLITSSIPQEGKSMVAANLACALAKRTQEKVLLIEGDLRRPTISLELGIGRHPGLCECLQGSHAIGECIYRLETAGLWILPAGVTEGNALELLQSERLSAIQKEIGEWFDWIIIDSPPILPLADTSIWSRSADGILLVTRQGTTEKRQLQRGLEAIETRKLIGALMNCSQRSENNDYYYGASAGSK